MPNKYAHIMHRAIAFSFFLRRLSVLKNVTTHNVSRDAEVEEHSYYLRVGN